MNYKKKANLTLLITAVLFCVCVVFRYLYRDLYILKLLLFVLEASLVGGIADWFAVTALFTKPLGFPYHTAIIPSNRKSIIKATSSMVEGELLSQDMIKRELDKINIADAIISWVEKEDKQYYINKLLASLNDYIAKKDLSKIAESIENFIKKEGKELNLTEALKGFVHKKFKKEEKEIWITKAVEAISSEKCRERIEEQVKGIMNDNGQNGMGNFAKNLLQKINVLNPDDLTGIIQTQLVNLLVELKNPDGSLSAELENNLIEAIDGINNSNASIDEWKNELLSSLSFKEVIEKQLYSLLRQMKLIEYSKINDEAYMFAAVTEDEEVSKQLLPVLQWLNSQIGELWQKLKENENIKNYIDNFIKGSIYKVIELKHNAIGNIAADALNDFSDEELNEFVESKAGEDLQWIRINGSVLGASIGLIIFLFLNLLYSPLIEYIKHML